MGISKLLKRAIVVALALWPASLVAIGVPDLETTKQIWSILAYTWENRKCVYDTVEFFMSSMQKSPTADWHTYDIVVNENGATLMDLGSEGEGWKVFFNDSTSLKRFEEERRRGKFVSVIGLFDAGKSWLINLLADKSFPSDYSMATLGISLVLPDVNNVHSKIVWVDTPGVSRSSPDVDLKNRLATDEFLLKFGMEFGDVVLLVTSSLTLESQKRWWEIRDKIRQITDCNTAMKELIIVHNFGNMVTMPQVKGQIAKDILIFGGEKQMADVLLSRSGDRYERKQQEYYLTPEMCGGKPLQTRHVIFANDDSPAGEHWNEGSKALLLQFIANYEVHNRRFIHESINEVVKSLEPMLPSYFEAANGKDALLQEEERGWFDWSWLPRITAQKLATHKVVGKDLITLFQPMKNGKVVDDYKVEFDEEKSVLRLQTLRKLNYMDERIESPLDWYNIGEHSVIEVEVPGMALGSADDGGLHCEYISEDNMLLIKGQRQPSYYGGDKCGKDSDVKATRRHVSSRRYGVIQLGIKLEHDMDGKSLQKQCEDDRHLVNGVLTLTTASKIPTSKRKVCYGDGNNEKNHASNKETTAAFAFFLWVFL